MAWWIGDSRRYRRLYACMKQVETGNRNMKRIVTKAATITALASWIICTTLKDSILTIIHQNKDDNNGRTKKSQQFQ